jgi:hypothetical protein
MQKLVIFTALVGLLIAACGSDGAEDEITVASPTEVATSPGEATPTNAPSSTPTRVPPTATPTAEPELTVVESGFVPRPADSLGNVYAMWTTVLRNDSSKAAIDVEVRALLYDGAGTLVGTDIDYLPVVFPGTTIAAGSNSASVSAAPTRADFRVEVTRYTDTETETGFAVEGATFVPDRFSSKVTFSVTSPYAQDLEDLSAVCLVKDAAGALVGVAQGYIDFLPAQTTATSECTFFGDEINAAAVASAEAYVSISSLTALQLE